MQEKCYILHAMFSLLKLLYDMGLVCGGSSSFLECPVLWSLFSRTQGSAPCLCIHKVHSVSGGSRKDRQVQAIAGPSLLILQVLKGGILSLCSKNWQEKVKQLCPLFKGTQASPKRLSDKCVQSLFHLCHQGHSAPLRRELSIKNNFSTRDLRHMEKNKLK